MHTSLGRIDIVTKAKDGGRPGYILTDHRSAAEIESEPELSALFAMTRVIAATTMGAREGEADVSYVCATVPPSFLHEAVVSAGGRVSVEHRPVLAHPSPRDVGAMADAAFSGLAERVRRRDGGALDEALLGRLEEGTLASPPKQEEDEGAYWTRLHELAAVCGELLRARTGGRWAEAADRNSLLPFAFVAGQATINVADKAQRFLDEGEFYRPSQLLRMVEDLETREGPLMVNLKPGDFPRDRGVCRELLEGTGPGGTRLPLVFLGHDQPNTFAYLPARTADDQCSFEEALANLARLTIPSEEHEIAGVKVLVVSNHFYASEKILDQSFMRTLHERLGAELLAAAIPCKGLLFVTGKIAPPAVLKFALMAETQYRDAEGGAPSPVVFLARDGKVVGHLDTSARPS